MTNKKQKDRLVKKFLRIEKKCKNLPVKAQVKKWKKRTGMSHVTYYRYKNMVHGMKKLHDTARMIRKNEAIERQVVQHVQQQIPEVAILPKVAVEQNGTRLMKFMIIYAIIGFTCLFLSAKYFGGAGFLASFFFLAFGTISGYNIKSRA